MARIRRFDLNNIPPARWTDLKKWTQVGDYMSFFSIPGDHSASGAEFDIGDHTEAWLQYQVWFAPDFDFGANLSAHSVGGKMPGLASSGPFGKMNGNYTGGNHDDQGHSGRNMWRAHQSQGRSWEPGDGICMGLYAYDYELAVRPDLKYGRNLMYRKPEANEVNPVAWEDAEGGNNGTGPGQIGDPDVWIVPLGEWITVTVGHGVGAANSDNWYEAWVSTESRPEPWRALRLEGATSRFRWMAPNADQKIDTFLFQSYWGGKGDIWLPTRQTEFRYRGIEVHDSNPLVSPLDIPGNPADPAPLPEGSVPITVSAHGSTGTERVELWVNGGIVQTATLSQKGVEGPGGVWHIAKEPVQSLAFRFINDGTSAGADRNAIIESVTIGNHTISSVAAVATRADDGKVYETAGHLWWNSILDFTAALPEPAPVPEPEPEPDPPSDPLPHLPPPPLTEADIIARLSRQGRIDLIRALADSLL